MDERELAASVRDLVLAAAHGDASGYHDPEILTAIGVIWISRRMIEQDPGEDEHTLPYLDQALEILAGEVEARQLLRANPFRDPGEQ